MGFIKRRSDYIKGLCETHKSLLHSSQQKAFIRLNDAEEFDAAVFAHCGRNVVAMMELSGSFEMLSDDAEVLPTTELRFYTKSEDKSADNMELAKDEAFDIMQDFIALITTEANDGVRADGSCPEIVDIESMTFTEAPEMENLFYGWTLIIRDRPENNVVALDQSKWTQYDE